MNHTIMRSQSGVVGLTVQMAKVLTGRLLAINESGSMQHNARARNADQALRQRYKARLFLW